MEKLFLDKLILIGINKNYEVKFKEGLNFISGPTSTGKSSIFEMINYALGSKKHKSYIEIGKKCSDVNLYLEIGSKKYKIERKLFDFNLPILVSEYDSKENIYKSLGTFSVDSSKKENFSNFILSKLGLSGLKVSNQQFSFRDLFKYAYLKQTEIDNEDIIGEKNWITNLKRKSTFEIIFNIYDELLSNLKEELKRENIDFSNSKLQFDGISEFLNNSDIQGITSIDNEKKKILKNLDGLKKQISFIKDGLDSHVPDSEKTRKDIQNLKSQITNLNEKISYQKEFIVKLNLLKNQYMNDIDKQDALMIGSNTLNKFEFVLCPNCLQPISTHQDGICNLCGKTLVNSADNILRLKSEKSSLVRRKNELTKYLLNEESKLEGMSTLVNVLKTKLTRNEQQLNELTFNYINPFTDKISYINIKIGENYKKLDTLNDHAKLFNELEILENKLKIQSSEIDKLKDKINNEKNKENKDDILNKVSSEFTQILFKFKFPKLNNSKIGKDDYLPYVRNRKYNDLGSLGGVTLITVAYYLAILLTSTDMEDSNSIGLLMIDTPSKNLGNDAKDNREESDFRDETIYKNMIDVFSEIGKKYDNKIQLLVINNGYPDNLSEKNIIKEFKPNGEIGLIDDI